MRFARKRNKAGLKKVQDNSKAMSAHAEAIKALVKPKEIKPKILNGGSCKLSQLACIAHPKLRKQAGAILPRVSVSAGQRPRLKPRPRLCLWLRLPKVLPSPHEGSNVEASACQCEDTSSGVTPSSSLGFWLHGAGILLCSLHE